MKKLLATLLATTLVLSGCSKIASTAAVTPTPDVSSATPSAADASSTEASSAVSASMVASSSLPDMPAPDGSPVTAIGAVPLPDVLGTSTAGYTIEAITPAQYDLVLDPQRGGYRGFPSADVFYLGQGGKYAVANAKGKLISGFEFEQDNYWNSVNGMVAPKKIGSGYGALSATDGTVLVPFTHDSVSTVNISDLISVRDRDTELVLDRAGKTIFTLERGDRIYVRGGDTIVLFQSGLLKFYRLSDYSLIDNFACDEMQLITDPDSSHADMRIAFASGGKWGFCDLEGNFIANPIYDEIGFFAGVDYVDFTQDGKKGVLRRDGKVVVKAQWEDLLVGERDVRVFENGKWGAITDVDSGKASIPPMYDELGRFGTDGNASFQKNDKYGMIDREGNEVISAKYDGPITAGVDANLDKGYFLVSGDAPFQSGIVGDNKVIFSNDYGFIRHGNLNQYTADDEPYNIIITPREKFGYIDRRGKLVIDAQFDAAEGFVAGRDFAIVQKNGKISLIDRKGNALLDTVFTDVAAFNPETMVFAMQYTTPDGTVKGCLVKITAGTKDAKDAKDAGK